jgi:hypothetical protein
VWGLALLSGLGGCASRSAGGTTPPPLDERFELPPGIRAVAVDMGPGTLEIIGDAAATAVKGHVHSRAGGPTFEQRVEGDVLRLRVVCPRNERLSCTTRVELHTPVDLSVSADLGPGEVQLRDLRGNVRLDLGPGQVRVEGLRGAELSVDMGPGQIDLLGLAVERIRADLGPGQLRIDAIETPASIQVDAGPSEIDVIVPVGEYQLEIASSPGNVRTSGITARDQATRRIAIDAGPGNVTVRGR